MIQQYIKDFTRAAKATGIHRINFYVEEKDTRELSVYQGELDRQEQSRLQRLFIEAEVDGFSGSVFVEDLSPERMGENIEIIQDSAHWGKRPFTPYELRSMPAQKESEDLVPIENVVSKMVDAEKAACAVDRRIEEVQHCGFFEQCGTITLADESGTLMTDHFRGGSFYITVAARSGESVQPGGRGCPFRGTQLPDMAALGCEAAEEALSKLDASSYPTGTCRAVLDRRVVSELLDAFMPAFFARNVQSHMSVLEGKLGQAVAGANITLVEDPTMPGGMRNRRFDDEGVPTAKKEILSEGILHEYLHNRLSATQDECKSGGNGFKTDFMESVATGYTNVYLQGGKSSCKELMEMMGEGLYITGVSGVFAGAHSASGDFSLIAQGYRVNRGKCLSAVNQITIAGNFFELLNRVEMLGCDETWMRTSVGCVRTPSIYVTEISISGEET